MVDWFFKADELPQHVQLRLTGTLHCQPQIDRQILRGAQGLKGPHGIEKISQRQDKIHIRRPRGFQKGVYPLSAIVHDIHVQIRHHGKTDRLLHR